MDLPTRYNCLPDLEIAQETFHNQLARAFEGKDPGQALKQLLSELAPLFPNASDHGWPIYSVWLLHGHYDLQPNQRMVTSRDIENEWDIMQPSEEASLHIVPEKWDNLGGELEHRQLADGDSPRPPPSDELWSSFKDIMQKRQITMLGIGFAPDEREMKMLEEGYLFLETTGHGNKSHIVKAVQDSVPNSVITTAWIPRVFPSNGDGPTDAELAAGTRPYVLNACTHVCTVFSHEGLPAK